MRAFLIGRSKFGGIVASLSVEKFRPLHHSPYTKARIQRCLLRPLKKVIMRFNAKGMYHFEPHFHHQIGHFIRLYYHPLCLDGQWPLATFHLQLNYLISISLYSLIWNLESYFHPNLIWATIRSDGLHKIWLYFPSSTISNWNPTKVHWKDYHIFHFPPFICIFEQQSRG